MSAIQQLARDVACTLFAVDEQSTQRNAGLPRDVNPTPDLPGARPPVSL